MWTGMRLARQNQSRSLEDRKRQRIDSFAFETEVAPSAYS